MTLIRYKLYNGSNRYKLKSPSFSGKGSFVKGLAVSLSEVASAHVNVTCFDGGDGSVTVVASGGTPPYQYSLDTTFATYNTDGVFSNLSLVGPVDESTDQYGGILISHRRFYVRDASGQIVSCVVDLKSPVEFEYLSFPSEILVFCDPAKSYATIIPGYNFVEPKLGTTSNLYTSTRIGWAQDNLFYSGITYNITYRALNRVCNKIANCIFTITALPLYFPNAVQDYDGNWYDAVVIGNQVWLAQNLRTTHYADGTPIPAGGSTTSDTDPYYYDYSTSNIPLNLRGYLYNWPAAMNGASSSDLNPSGVQGIAPTGWHIPSRSERQQLTDYIGSQSVYRYNNESYKIAKALAYDDFWHANEIAGTIGNDQSSNNASRFSLIPAGQKSNSSFYYDGIAINIWTTTEYANNNTYATSLYFQYNSPGSTEYHTPKSQGFSVRCVCDLSPLDFAAWYYDQYGSYNHQLPTE